MPIPRAILTQRDETLNLIRHKIRHDIFKFDKENLYSIDEIAKKLPRFTKQQIAEVIKRLDDEQLIVSIIQNGGTTYFGERYV